MRKSFRRFAAGIAAIAMLTAAIPAAALPVMAKDLISNSTFESGTTGWGMYKESGGDATLSTEDGKLAFKIASTGKKTYSVQMYYDIIPLYKGAKYRLSYDISCTTNRFVEGMIQQNGGDYTAYVWDGIDVTTTPQTVEHEFEMKYDTDIMAKLVFNCGLQEADGGALPEHTIYLDNVKLELIDDSNADKTVPGTSTAAILTNQVGYTPNAQKTAVVRGVTNQTEFKVMDAASKTAVYTGTLGAKTNNSLAGEEDCVADFSSVTAAGKYYIAVDGLTDSYTFEISNDPYSTLFDDSIKMLNLQRCGEAVEAGKFSHPACHTGMATIYGTNQQIDVSGGWHDAGDYGRYVVAGAKAVGDLLYAYLQSPNKAILDETKYELDWMMKMQADNGGVYHKVTCETFPGYVAPQDETEPLVVTPITSTATADFCASMALAAQAYKETDAAYAQKCLAAAEKAWAYLEANPNFDFKNPDDITTGAYGDKSDRDERYWAAAQLWITTGDTKYQQALNSIGTKTGLDWATVGDYGNIAILNGADKSSAEYAAAKAAVIEQADKFVKNSKGNPYGVALTKFDWGSNMTVANAGVICALAYQLTGNADYINAAKSQLDYLLGENPVGTCFVTGYGTVSPENPHHRPSMVAGEAMKGMLVGGVNSNLEDSAAKAYCGEASPAKCYIDNSESYSTNEITIYWNSPLTYLLTVAASDAEPAQQDSSENKQDTTEKQQDTTQGATVAPVAGAMYGDVNLDGTVDILDVIKLNKFLLGSEKLDDKAKTNADVDLNAAIDSTDSLNILKYVVEMLDSLPIGGGTPVQPDQPDQPTETTTERAQDTTEKQQDTTQKQEDTTQATEATTEATQPTSEQQDPTEPSSEAPVSGDIKDYGTPMNANATMVSDFRTGKGGDFIASNGWTNGACFDCWWHKENTSLDGGKLTLTIDQDKGGKGMYSGAEYRTENFYHYGYYETSMQAIKNDGVVSSFFTYTGPSDDNPWDEIDVEILGKDTTKVQFNYYTDGKGGHEFMYDLGFDASEGYHTYGFDWQPDHIDWYVDGVKVHTETGNVPKTPGKIMMNTWPGVSDPNNENQVIGWLNAYDGKTPLSAHYQWVTFNKADSAQQTTDPTQPTNETPAPTEPTQPTSEQQQTSNGIKDYGTPMNQNAKMVSDFRTGKGGDFIASDGWTNGACFDCWWHKSNTSLDSGMLTLTIDQDKGGKGMYSGAEYRTENFYQYGYFETSMQAIKNPGVVSSFFTYTGPSDVINGVKNPWDEIDIEVLGKDTTKVQFNYYTNGVGGHEFMYDLGFDASEGFHTFGFDWRPDRIDWYVDGVKVYSATDNIPKTAGKIMMNTWPGVSDPSNENQVIDWLQAYDGKTPLSAHYQWVTFDNNK